jgi:hypothetical protein
MAGCWPSLIIEFAVPPDRHEHFGTDGWHEDDSVSSALTRPLRDLHLPNNFGRRGSRFRWSQRQRNLLLRKAISFPDPNSLFQNAMSQKSLHSV